MSERGVFAVDRGIWDHPLLDEGAAFTPREAWLWLLSEAAWRPHRKRVGSVTVEVARGQVAHSYRFISDRWKWSLGKVQRFLRRLETDTMIETASDTGILLISICNYTKYQKVSLPTDTPSDTPSDTRPIRDRYRLEGKETKETPSETSSLRDAGEPARVVAKPASERDQFVAVLSEGITPERAATIADYRKRQKWPLSAQSARLMVKNLIACGDPNAGADLVIERGWRGFEPSWLGRNQDPRAGPTGSRDAPPRLRGSDRLLSTMNGMFDDDQPATSAQPTLRLGAHSTADEA